jgi:uncharacterized membrane protein
VLVFESNVLIAIVLICVCALAYRIECQPWGRRVPAVVVIIFISTFLSNTGVLPYAADFYQYVFDYLVPVAIPLLLLKANLREIFSSTGRVLLLFCVGAAGTVLGGVLGFVLLDLDSETQKLVSVFAATNIGGSINLVSMIRISELDNPELITSALAADSMVGFSYLFMLTLLPAINILQRFMPSKYICSSVAAAVHADDTKNVSKITFSSVLLVLLLGVAIFLIAQEIARYFAIEKYSILVITALAIVIANSAPQLLKKQRGDFELGMFFMYLFFAVIGASTNIFTLFDSAIEVVLLNVIIVATHIVFLLLVGGIFKLDLADLIIASNACVLGPPTAAAYAASRGWTPLVTPAIMCGILGYVIANFISSSLMVLLL